ncbi:MAG: deoxyhypusine synthase [Methanobacteriaceae archaeon]|nr:deoxyhypusine synthase [Methanobacteriaceae archaeon]
MQTKQIKITENMKVSELMDQLRQLGVLGAGRLSKASDIYTEAIKDKDTKIFLSLAGPMIPGGLRVIISDLIKLGYVDLIISSGANITHDLLEAFGGHHYKDIKNTDNELRSQGIGRIGDVYTKSNDFEIFEKEVTKLFGQINKKYEKISIKDFLYEIGLLLNDNNSILKSAADYNVPIYAPGIIDCMLGLQLWIYTQDHEFVLDAIGDMHDLSNFVFDSPKVMAFMLGGGLPKHYTLASNILTGGIHAGVQITMDRSEAGSLSGAPLEEAISWSKAESDSNLVTVVGDATVLFPLIVADTFDKLKKE